MSASRPNSTTHGYVVLPSLRSPPASLRLPSLRSLPDPAPRAQPSDTVKGLIKSSQRADQQTGVRLLSDIFRESPDRRRECLYYLALGHYKLGNYSEARRYNDLLLDNEPTNMQAGSLRELIDDKVAKEGMVGVAILSGVAVAVGVVGGVIFRGMARKR